MEHYFISGIVVAYFCLIFALAYRTRESRFIHSNIYRKGYIYALSLGIYCTAWTFYGSVGRANNYGVDYLAVYLGPSLIAPLWLLLVRRIIIISQNLRITSIADFISTRYGKSTSLGILVAFMAILSSIPYISIQLKAIDWSYHLIIHRPFDQGNNLPIYADSSVYFALALTIFAIIFGTRHLDPNEKHPGIVNAIAFESVIKLIAFLAIGIYVCWYLFGSPIQIFQQAFELPGTSAVFTLDNREISTWVTILIISAAASLFLPRQFHLLVIENQNVSHINKAMWIFPLYLLLISIFVIPIALAGKLLLPSNFSADYYVIGLPFYNEHLTLYLLAFIGGLSAAASMVAIELLALSIMTSNNILLPLLLRNKLPNHLFTVDITKRLLWIRRVIIFAIMLLAYGFYQAVSIKYPLVSIGLISFVGISQLVPSIIFGLFWRKATKAGAIVGLAIGLITWFYTLPFTNLVEIGIVSESVLSNGPWDISWLRPNSLFGYDGMGLIPHGAFWSLFLNIFFFVIISMNTKSTPDELAQADIFLNYEKYFIDSRVVYSPINMKAKTSDLKKLFEKIFGYKEASKFFKKYTNQDTASPELLAEVEKKISGALGATSAGFMMKHMVKHEPVNVDDMVQVLNQTYQVFLASEESKRKSEELKIATEKLKIANEKLVELDELKNEFIGTITHELRTPITAIRSFANILKDYHLPESKKVEYLEIISKECTRISNLVNKVLDIKKLEYDEMPILTNIIPYGLVQEVISEFDALKGSRTITYDAQHTDRTILTDEYKLKQCLINILSNAIKYTDPVHGEIHIKTQFIEPYYHVDIIDNGIGIEEKDLPLVFEKFYQVKGSMAGGTGLGLAITKKLIESLKGSISISSIYGEGSRVSLTVLDCKLENADH